MAHFLPVPFFQIPMRSGPSGHYSQGGDYFATTRTTSVPVPIPTLKAPVSKPSKPEYSSSESSSLSSTPFTSVSPVAAFSSDTSAATHYSSTTSISGDQPHGVFMSHLAQRPGGATGPGFQLRFNAPDKEGPQATQARISSVGGSADQGARQPTDLSHESVAAADEVLPMRHSRSLGGASAPAYDASQRPFLRGQTPSHDQAGVPHNFYPHHLLGRLVYPAT